MVVPRILNQKKDEWNCKKKTNGFAKKRRLTIENKQAFDIFSPKRESMNSKKYLPRVADKEVNLRLRAFGATNIVGPKWCGKTRTAIEHTKSQIFLQDNLSRSSLLYTAKLSPKTLLNGEQPRLIDEWQDAPVLWDAIRSYCDSEGGQGHFILTGSTAKQVDTMHTGTGRISTLKMYPMSLFESLESNGQISLKDLFDDPHALKDGCQSMLTLENLIQAACRGGWPQSLCLKDSDAKMAIAKDYINQICTKDLYSVDSIKRNPQTMRAILKSYARNISTLAKNTSLLADVSATNPITKDTLDDYIGVLEKLFVVEDIYGWCPQIRSKTAMRSGRKREFVDPSIACAALGGSPEHYLNDLKTFGFIFETMCIRDLRVYSSALGGEISYYRDNLDLECDCVLHLDDGRYALIEFKLGDFEIEEGAGHLNKLEALIKNHNKTGAPFINEPNLKVIVTGSSFGYRREDGVYVVPIGCLKD